MFRKNWVAASIVATAMLAIVPAKASVLISFQETGGDVVATLSGSMDLTGETIDYTTSTFTFGPLISPTAGFFRNSLGTSQSIVGYYSVVSNASYPYGSTSNIFATSSSGDFFTLAGSNIFLSSGYGFGSALNGSMTFVGATLSSLGLNLGDTVYNVVTGDNITIRAVSVSPTPLPAALPLFAGGLGVIGLLVRRRKRKTAAAFESP